MKWYGLSLINFVHSTTNFCQLYNTGNVAIYRGEYSKTIQFIYHIIICNFWFVIFISLMYIYRNPISALELDRDLELFQLNGESIIKRMCQMPSENGNSDRGFIMLSSDRLLRELVTWGNKAVMDATFKVC